MEDELAHIRMEPSPGRVRVVDGDRAEFVFDDPQPAITPGQAVVFNSRSIPL